MTEEDRMKRFVRHKIKVLKELGVSLTTEDEKRLATPQMIGGLKTEMELKSCRNAGLEFTNLMSSDISLA